MDKCELQGFEFNCVTVLLSVGHIIVISVIENKKVVLELHLATSTCVHGCVRSCVRSFFRSCVRGCVRSFFRSCVRAACVRACVYTWKLD